MVISAIVAYSQIVSFHSCFAVSSGRAAAVAEHTTDNPCDGSLF